MFTIGTLAKKAQISTDSIRFYERQGLIPDATKNTSGYRLYTEAALQRLTFIRHAQRCGFTLSEIKQLLELHNGGTASARALCRIAAQKKAEIEETMSALQAMSQTLSRVIERCGADEALEAAPDRPLPGSLENELARQAA